MAEILKETELTKETPKVISDQQEYFARFMQPDAIAVLKLQLNSVLNSPKIINFKTEDFNITDAQTVKSKPIDNENFFDSYTNLSSESLSDAEQTENPKFLFYSDDYNRELLDDIENYFVKNMDILNIENLKEIKESTN